jgi:hypothetical protein
VAQDDPPVPEPADARREHVLLPTRHEHLRADQARVGDPADPRDRDVDAACPGPEDEDERQHQHIEGERHDDVDDPHDCRVEHSAVVAAEAAEERAEDEREEHREEADLEVDPGGVEQPRPDVASELIGSEPVLRGRPGERVQEILRRGARRVQKRREQRGQRDCEQDRGSR